MQYIALYDRHGVEDSEEYDNYDGALQFLESGNDKGECFPVAIIKDGKMVWHCDFLGHQEAKERVDIFINAAEGVAGGEINC